MTLTLTVRDETTTGEKTGELTLDFLTERVTVRELIRSRVYQEVKDFNTRRPGLYRGLVQPREAEAELGGYRVRSGQELDWREQFDAALGAFERGRVLILAGGRQVESLEDEVVVGPDAEATFLKLVPLVGG